MTTAKGLKTLLAYINYLYVIVNTKTSVKSFRSNRGSPGGAGG